MKSRNSKWIIAFILICVGSLCVWLWWIQPELRYRNTARKYPVGTSAEKILQDYGDDCKLSSSDNILPEPITENDKRKYVFYFLILQKDNAEIKFNYYREVISVNRLTDFKNPR